MSSLVDLDALDKHYAESHYESRRDAIVFAYPALRDEIKRLRLELAAAKQHIRACHAAAHGSAGIAEEAIGNHLRLLEQARKLTRGQSCA